MEAAILNLEDYQPNRKFKVPLRSEVEKYIKDKTNWPDQFCNYYSEKFWDFYNSQGWKLSNGNQMKDWRSAFNANWQKPKYPEDIKMLKDLIEKHSPIKFVDYIDKILIAYSRGLKPDRESALKIYDWLKEHGMAKLSKEEIADIKTKCGEDITASRLWSVKYIFDKMVSNNLTFSQIWKR